MDDEKDSATFVVFDKEITKLTKKKAVVLALEEVFLVRRNIFKLKFLVHSKVLQN